MTRRIVAGHADWLTLVEPVGPFLTLPVLRRVWPGGLDRTPAPLRGEFKDRVEALGPDDASRKQFVNWVLRHLLAYGRTVREGQAVPATLTVTLPEHGTLLRPDFAVVEPQDDTVARLLVNVWPAGTDLTAHVDDDRWAASPVDRMATLCRQTGVQLGLVTDGDRYQLVWAPGTGPIGRATWIATVLAEPREAALLDSFTSVLGAKRLFSVGDKDRLEALLLESASAQAEVTAQLGFQVRRAVEMLVWAFSNANQEQGGGLLAGLDPHIVYEAACTVMMRLVFLLYAEERRLLPLGEELYDRSYAVSTLRQDLRDLADAIGNDETLEHSYTAWPRLLATFRAMYAGLTHDELRLPAYGGRLFDPDRFAFLEGRRPGQSWRDAPSAPIPVDDRTVLAALTALQILELREGGVTEARRLSFRSLDVEQIGHVYEGLLDHGTRRIDSIVLGLIGRPGEEPEVELDDLLAHEEVGDEDFVAWLVEITKRSERQIRAALETPLDDVRYRALRAACNHDADLLDRVKPYGLLIRDDIRRVPMVMHPGAIYVTEVSHRRDTGTEYTTKELADEVVRYALEPLVYNPGPAEGAAPEEWKLKTAAEILDLRVCDPAVGSGAIITAACRYLGDRLVEAWKAEGTVPTIAGADPFDDVDDVVIAARRAVAERCLYGVDRDQMAVEMAKLSLWLVTMAKERPFSFLDHSFRAGDSLLGVTRLEQVTRFNIDPGAAQQSINFAGDLEPLVKEALELRTRLESVPVVTLRDVEEKARLLDLADRAMRTVHVLADLVVGAALSTVGTRNDINGRLAGVANAVIEALEAPLEERGPALDGLQGRAGAWLNERRPAAAPLRRALHWPLAFPEVFLDGQRRGFDAMIGNPPYMHGQKITGTQGVDIREYVVAHLASGRRGSADLVTYFFLLASRIGRYVGFLATNTIAQGDTREVGLDQLLLGGWTVFRAVRSTKWPGAATLEIAKVWMTNATWHGQPMLDGSAVEGVTSTLEAATRVGGTPERLEENARLSFQGSIPLGLGFTMSPTEAHGLIAADDANAEVLMPYLIGRDVVESPTQTASRWIINFFDWPETKARDYATCFRIVEQSVKPDRIKNPRAARRERWWQFAEKALGLYAAIGDLDKVMVVPRISKVALPVLVPRRQVFDQQVTVLAYDDYFHFGLLTSAVHWLWVVRWGSTHETRLRYMPSDVFETFPQPTVTKAVTEAGDALDKHRSAIMIANDEGLTKTYNRFHDPDERRDDVETLRKLHSQLDHAVADAYRWSALNLGHGFHTTTQGVRFTVQPSAQVEILDRLLEENHRRYAAEQSARARTGGAKKARATKKMNTPIAGQITMFASPAPGEDQ